MEKVNTETFWDKACVHVPWLPGKYNTYVMWFAAFTGLFLGIATAFKFAQRAKDEQVEAGGSEKNEREVNATPYATSRLLYHPLAGAILMASLGLFPARLNCHVETESLCKNLHGYELGERAIAFPCILLLTAGFGYHIFRKVSKDPEDGDETSFGFLGALHAVLQLSPFLALFIGHICCDTGVRYEWYLAECIVLILGLPRLALLMDVNPEHRESYMSLTKEHCGGEGPILAHFIASAFESVDLFLDSAQSCLAVVCGYIHAKAMVNCVLGSWALQNCLVLFLTEDPYLFVNSVMGVGPEAVLRSNNIPEEHRRQYARTLALARLVTENLPMMFFQYDFLRSKNTSGHQMNVAALALGYVSLTISSLNAIRGVNHAMFKKHTAKKAGKLSLTSGEGSPSYSFFSLFEAGKEKEQGETADPQASQPLKSTNGDVKPE